MEKVTEKTTLAKILKIKGAERILAKYSVPCLGCAMASLEMDKLKVGDICRSYGIDDKKLIEELNKK